MTLPDMEKLNTAIVVLSGVDATVNLANDELSKIIREPNVMAIGQPPAEIEITSLRDQVAIKMGGGKFQFQDKSDQAPGTSKLPDIVHGFVGLLQSKGVDRFTAYGINFDVAFDARGDEPASEVIANRYVNKERISEQGRITIRGAGLRLYFEHSEGAVCDLKIEPRLGKADASRFFAHINYHFELPNGTMPSLENLKTMYHGLWPQFVDLLERLLSRS